MIKNYRDQAANERTFLAWVRTAIAVMAFGFLVEKFDLFLRVTAPAQTGQVSQPSHLHFGRLSGLTLIVLGTAMIVLAIIRFLKTAKAIKSEQMNLGPGSHIDIGLATMLVLLGLALFGYLSHGLLGTI